MSARARSRVAAGVLVLALGCRAALEDYRAPGFGMPARWYEETGPGLRDAAAELADWWSRFADPQLAALVERALRGSPELREALERVSEARALRAGAWAELWPQIEAIAVFEQRGRETSAEFGNLGDDEDFSDMSAATQWELDLWGRLRSLGEAADAELGGRAEEALGAALAIAAETALGYVDLRAQQTRLALAQRNVELQSETLELVSARLDAGLVSARDAEQARANLQSTRAQVPALELRARAAQNRLAVLLGVAPGGPLAAELAAPAPIPAPPAELAVGVPADLLRRRPDVRAAERALAAATARSESAWAELKPKLFLFGRIGASGTDPSEVFEGTGGLFGIGPTVRWTLFDAGRLASRARAQDARAVQARLRWERSVLGALEEAENAMSGFVREQQRARALTEAAQSAREAAQLARIEYRSGIADFQAVLDSERVLAALEDQRAQSEAAVAAQWIALYRALGGGWTPAAPLPPPAQP